MRADSSTRQSTKAAHPDEAWKPDVRDDTAEEFLTPLSLLMPAFSLPIASTAGFRRRFTGNGNAPLPLRAKREVRSFGSMLEPR